MVKHSNPFMLLIASALLIALSACTPAVLRPKDVTAADFPPGAASLATAIQLEVVETAGDITSKIEPADIDDHKAIAFNTLKDLLAPEKLEVIAAPNEAPLKILLKISLQRTSRSVSRGGVFIEATVSNGSGKDLFTTLAGEPLTLMSNRLDTKIALRNSIQELRDGIIRGLKPLRSPAS